MAVTPGDDLRRTLTSEEIDTLVASGQWFPFIETWSLKTPLQMFGTLVASPYGGGVATMPKASIQFMRHDFSFSFPDRFRKPIPLLAGPTGTMGNVILTHDVDMRDYREMNGLSEFYMEDLRLASSKRRFMKETPMQMWDNPSEAHKILQLARQRHGPDAGPYEIRNAVVSVTKESNPFRPSVALAMYSIFNAKNILDMSAGWGDRLVGAIAWAARSGKAVRYQGYDPFSELQPRYKAIVNDLTKLGETKVSEDARFEVTCAPFEAAEIEESGFDLAFTSPPYFDFEEYGFPTEKRDARADQSTIRYPTLREWVDKFLKGMMSRAAQSLRRGGHLAINIEGTFMYAFLEDVGLYPKFGDAQMEYVGIVGYHSDVGRDQTTHPTFVWRRS